MKKCWGGGQQPSVLVIKAAPRVSSPANRYECQRIIEAPCMTSDNQNITLGLLSEATLNHTSLPSFCPSLRVSTKSVLQLALVRMLSCISARVCQPQLLANHTEAPTSDASSTRYCRRQPNRPVHLGTFDPPPPPSPLMFATNLPVEAPPPPRVSTRGSCRPELPELSGCGVTSATSGDAAMEGGLTL